MRSAVRSLVNPARWWQTLLHNQRALMNQATRLFALDVIVAAAPHPLAREGEIGTCADTLDGEAGEGVKPMNWQQEEELAQEKARAQVRVASPREGTLTRRSIQE